VRDTDCTEVSRVEMCDGFDDSTGCFLRVAGFTHFVCCLLLINKARAKRKTYI
jgi:hypothetical protein